MADGIVFEIQRFALDEGPGIRSCVYLKGCNMRCAWCDRPEGIRPDAELSYDFERCVECGQCTRLCPDVHRTDSGRHELHRANCQVCGRCAEGCLYGALRVIGRRMEHGEVLQEVLRDRRYFDQSGGGLTLTGGEPLAQPEFSEALLREAKKAGLHTCVATNANALISGLAELMPHTDLFLMDYKLSDPDQAERHTGAESYIALSNIRALGMLGANVVIRCPIIEGLNDNDEHLKAIAELSSGYPSVLGFELIGYRADGLARAKRIGQQPPSKFDEPTDERLEQWKRRVLELGGRSHE